MIATNSLAAFTPAIGRSGATRGPTTPSEATPVRGTAPTASVAGKDAGAQQRTLDAVPSQPTRPLPRGSLLDLKV